MSESADLRVVWATDGSASAHSAIPLLRQAVLPATERLVVLTVAPHGVFEAARPEVSFLTRATKSARAHALTLARQSAEHDAVLLDPPAVQVEAVSRWGHAIEEVLRAATSLKADLIVVGARGHSGLALILVGSVSQGVVQHSTRPVLVARPGPEPLTSVLIGYDGSAAAKKAVRFLDRLALGRNVRFVLTCVIEPFAVPETTPPAYRRKALEEAQGINQHRHEHAEKAVEALAAELTANGRIVTQEVLAGPAAPLLDDSAQRHEAGLIVVGSRKPSASGHYLLGSTAEKLVRHAHASVLVVR